MQASPIQGIGSPLYRRSSDLITATPPQGPTEKRSEHFNETYDSLPDPNIEGFATNACFFTTVWKEVRGGRRHAQGGGD